MIDWKEICSNSEGKLWYFGLGGGEGDGDK